ncbi:hypothetical protein Vretimale_5571 [Volvox reticuliferus]|uniref:Uncharacterized protein n=1 Tax=Volvox reticuliferus TaxID=1737510 RepID=A0A8J4LK53_9CHLO|nr:hypothetical protein Vretifemale_5593 [Volvox reticuliferus]GIM00610.1 hypothetical protein Vretimale_5571 [Volvox reticuliferus]
MSEQQQQQPQNVEHLQPAQTQDPLAPLDRAHFVQDLQELGLLEFAEEVNFSRLTEAPGDVGLSSSRPGPVGHNNPPALPAQSIDVQQCHINNQKSEVMTAQAIQVLHLSKVGLHQLINTYNPRGAGSGGTDGSSKRRKTSRGADVSSSRSGSKGLRHFSMKVCEKVEAKGRTTYNEVADELVYEMSKMEAANKNGQYDEKNIRRRVYDAINVLMAMDIIQKERKEITWKGFPRLGNHSLEKLKADRLARIKDVEQKQLYLQDMIEKQRALKKLLERSAIRGANPSGTQLYLPFILVQAKPDATVEVKISEDMMDVQFDFYNSPFQVHDDSHVLKKLAEQQARQQQQQQPPIFPNALAGALALQWQQPNGAAAAMAGGLDPALAHLAVAAAQAQAQGNPLTYTYPPAAAAAAAYYQQQQLIQHHQQQQQQQGQQQPASQSAPAGQPQGQQEQELQLDQGQQQGHAALGSTQPKHQAPQQQQNSQQQASQLQAKQDQQPLQPQASQQKTPQQQALQPKAKQQHAQQQQLQQHHLQTLQTLHALQHARGNLHGLAMPSLGAPLVPPMVLQASSRPPFGDPRPASVPPPPHASQLAGQLTASLPPGSAPLLASLPLAAGVQGSMPPPPTNVQPATTGEAPLQHGMQKTAQLTGPAPATAFPLVA